MLPVVCTLTSFAEVQSHVLEVLCSRDRIDPAQAELRQARLTRGGAVCGVLFEVCGPRRLRTYAIWSGDDQRILFYESTGTRFSETRLLNGPRVCEVKDSLAETCRVAG